MMPLMIKTLFRPAALVVAFCSLLSTGSLADDMPAKTPVSTLERIRDSGRIRIGYGDTPPFSYQLPDGRVVGYSIDLCKELVRSLSVELGLAQVDIEYVYRTPRNRVQLLNDGSIDIECNASTNTGERRRSAAFALSHFYAASRYVSLSRRGLRTIEDLRGHSVSVALGTVNVGEIAELNRDRKLNLSVIPAEGLQAAFDMVKTGQVSAFAMDDVLLSTMIATSDRPQDFSLSSELVSKPQPYGLMMRLGDDAFKRSVNRALVEVYRGPKITEIYRRWFEQPIPPDNINLHQPMNDHLLRALSNPQEEPDI